MILMSNCNMFSPLEQFEVIPIIFVFKIFEYFGLVPTNFALFSLLFFFILFSFSMAAIFNPKFVPSTVLSIFEEFYLFVFDMVSTNLGKKGHKFFPLVFFLFLFLLAFNLFGLFPYSFTITSSIVVASLLSFSMFSGLVIIALLKYRLNFLALFFPDGAPVSLAFLLVPIEIVSFFSRPFSLAIRLFANMTAGHVLLKILVGFTITVISSLTGLLWHFNPFEIIAFNNESLPYVFSLAGGYAPTYINFQLFSPMFFVLPSEVILDSLNQSFVFNTCVVDCSRLCKMELPLFDGLLKFSDLCPLHDTNETSFLAKITELARYIEAKNIYAFYSSSDFGFSEYLPIFFSLTFSLELILAFLSVSATCILNTLIAIIPILVVCVFIFLEIFVATLQSYVFAILTVIYLRDTITLH